MSIKRGPLQSILTLVPKKCKDEFIFPILEGKHNEAQRVIYYKLETWIEGMTGKLPWTYNE